MKKTVHQKGFTLLELMVVIAVVAILAAVALPAYQDYMVRAKVAEGVRLASTAKFAVTETAQIEGVLVADMTEAANPTGYASPRTDYVRGIRVGNAGVITIATQNTGASADPVFTLTPSQEALNNPVTWACGLNLGLEKHLPANCR